MFGILVPVRSLLRDWGGLLKMLRRCWTCHVLPVSGSRLLSASLVRLWNTANRHPFGGPIQASARDGVYGVAFSPDSRLLATADGDGTVRW